jgi:hypothetical protein
VFFVIYVDLGDYTLYNSRILGADHLAIVENGGVANPPIFLYRPRQFFAKKTASTKLRAGETSLARL